MISGRRALLWGYYRLMVPIWRRRFAPRIILVNLADRSFRFFVATPQSADWYNPPKPYTVAEYEWLARNIDLSGQEVIDAGAHHGHYSLIFAMGAAKPRSIRAIEPLPSNCAIIEVNAALNRAAIEVIESAISTVGGTATFIPRGNGKLFPGTGIRVQTLTLPEVSPNASIVKLDIEGAEFEIVKQQIDQMKQTHTWIVEVHPSHGAPDRLVQEFSTRDFKVLYVEKKTGRIMPYSEGSIGSKSTTIFATR